ncbi:1-(5-phosphoribosyl)-5-[(5-phosphoribosylamino)methylideneamino] imidazole-4-carboxamide isomerase [Thalassococcus sp. CAU 1522]|uniref:1-(5-phosphoribosyl)-5-[(5-phosphoribosylamino)methylideneamino] imidazole-4-carboxamide isomerase n=1 Tax=Thalassococcus arenae TaxID=2851652 RepID=A0ABS6NBF9_9RHOB|nr:1-(5-phosphoribosyl)-5-[(5-phosphoribosylamino)methylideneamino] imidazole-4-carboxamide isomerase [Thalassococcus arenae]MBV2361361.1 1-(5-phosphoribosyl)-5-[(5-phosphoribosylamino)methylideneamino] imidazole-4-carboxamide isomerase [Thalassococcus arenae]
MQIIPTIELKSGRSVSLRKGRLDDAEIWHVDPVATAQSFAGDGAELMRITDFDAIAGGTQNDALIEEIIRKAGIPVQVAGGIRSRERAEHWIDRGAGQVVIGTLAAQAPQVVKALAKAHPAMIALSLDIRGGKLVTHGWNEASALDPNSFLASFATDPLASVIVTDIDNDDAQVDAQLGLITGLAAETRHPVIASGVVNSLDDISRLHYVPNVAGAIVGRALMRQVFTLADALKIARSSGEAVAEFQ